MNPFAALRRTPEDDLLLQPTDDELLAWAEDLRSTHPPRPKRTRQLVAAPLSNGAGD